MTTASSSSRPNPSSLPSTSSVRLSVRSSSRHPLPPPVSTVITSPPWAKDEPPSPKETEPENDHRINPESRPSDVISLQSSLDQPSRWWAFTLPRTKENSSHYLLESKSDKKNSAFRGSKSWLPSPASALPGSTFSRRQAEKGNEATDTQRSSRRDWDFSIPLPAAAAAPFTLTHNQTPGWETPWSSRVGAQGPRRNHERENSYGLGEDIEASDDNSSEKDDTWRRRKKRLRIFILNNTYVPLLFRVVNLTFTGAALGVSVRIRHDESQSHIMGAVGPSPTLVIIFAPLTLLHVMVAIYLEYFGRPLGLWRTSGKLFHTLLEVLFIVAWSAALALCADNYFTSLIPCSPYSTTAWYNELPRPPSNLPTFEGSIGDRICDFQLSLICLVAIGLFMYCINLVISLFRIFEKVKYLPAAPRLGTHR